MDGGALFDGFLNAHGVKLGFIRGRNGHTRAANLRRERGAGGRDNRFDYLSSILRIDGRRKGERKGNHGKAFGPWCEFCHSLIMNRKQPRRHAWLHCEPYPGRLFDGPPAHHFLGATISVIRPTFVSLPVSPVYMLPCLSHTM